MSIESPSQATFAGATRSGEISLFAFAVLLVRQRRRIAWCALAGGLLGAGLALTIPKRYVSTASFIPQGTDATRSGLASLAGQLGVNIPSAGQSQSPDFYVVLLQSPVLIDPIAADTLVVPELGGKRIPVVDLLNLPPGPPALRREEAGRQLTKFVSAAVVKLTGIVEVNVSTPWPSVSQMIASRLVRGVDEFNQNTRRAQASAERQFVEKRLALADMDLRSAEDRLERFLAGNRALGSPELTFQRERLQRDVNVKQQVFMTLTQSYEEVRIREVRDTPVISLIEAPSVPVEPQPRHRVTIVVVGILLGAFLAIAFSVVAATLARRRQEGSVEAEDFAAVLDHAKRSVVRRLRPRRAPQHS